MLLLRFRHEGSVCNKATKKKKESQTKSLFNRSITSLDFVLKHDVEARCSQMCSNGSPGSLLKACQFFGCVALKSLFHSPYRVFCVCPVFGLRRPLRSEQGSLLQSYQHLRAWFTFVISVGFLKRSDRVVI